MVKWKYIAGFLGAVILYAAIWFVHPANDQVDALEDQLSTQYTYANFILRDTVEELLEWDFSQPLTEENIDDFRKIFYEFRNIKDLFFSGYTVHHEWEDRLFDADMYLMNYEQSLSLSEEDAADLEQILQATRFISRDFYDYTGHGDFYDAMQSGKHEMVERVKSRLEMEY
ncbi:hypothetical protein ACTHOQ_04150 [Solibacillus silvestris]|uniref:hypothetical protein n=1 Tax=Solibacillus silvestris TaxID=76853 RepID=UPI003F7DADCD